jgi:hypothetical protein
VVDGHQLAGLLGKIEQNGIRLGEREWPAIRRIMIDKRRGAPTRAGPPEASSSEPKGTWIARYGRPDSSSMTVARCVAVLGLTNMSIIAALLLQFRIEGQSIDVCRSWTGNTQ